MDNKKEITKNELREEDLDKVSGGAIFEVNCSSCGKKINSAEHRWGHEDHGSWTGCKGYFCNECVEKFRKGDITDKDLLDKFNQLDNRGDANRYSPL